MHFANTFAGTLVSHMDNGVPVTALSGVHSGCYELFAHEPIRTISELRGKRIAIQDLNSDGYYYLAIMAAHVGLDPKTRLRLGHQSRRQPHGALRRRARPTPFSRSRPSRRS